MPIPALDGHGLLPVGIHDCTWPEVEERFCWNAKRVEIFGKLTDFLAQRWAPLNLNLPIFVDGSFTRQTDTPKDVDIVIDASVVDAAAIVPVYLLWFVRDEIKANFMVDFWFKHPSLPTDLSAYFCYTGLKAGAELGLDAKHPKGILRVNP
jgi:hypothetical protein